MLRKDKLYEIIFEADTRAGKLFDVALIFLILTSILLVMLDSMQTISDQYRHILRISEWIITLTFTVEYLLRIYIVHKPWRYITSFYGIIDLLAIIPTYLGLIVAGGQGLIVIRAIRLLRVFRILKLTRYTRAGRFLVVAMVRSREKIFIFLFFVLTLVVIFGTIMYIVEGPEHGFTSIPTSIYWAIVTLTTVGYGDISPSTGFGQFLASLIMITGYAIIAVPTGIVTSEMLSAKITSNTQVCSNCLIDRHDDDALFCKKCGHSLHVIHRDSEGDATGQEQLAETQDQ
jgi:voltage-gated potassium channel